MKSECQSMYDTILGGGSIEVDPTVPSLVFWVLRFVFPLHAQKAPMNQNSFVGTGHGIHKAPLKTRREKCPRARLAGWIQMLLFSY